MLGRAPIWFAAVITGALFAGGGCAPLNLRGNGFGDSSAGWGETLRPPTQPGNIVGVDSRAREIERNVGMR